MLAIRSSLAAVVAILSLSAFAGAAVSPLQDVPERVVQGLNLTIEPVSGGQADRRTARLLALYVPEGTPPTSFLKPGPFKATFDGLLFIKLRNDFTFTAEGSGTIKVEVNGEAVLEGTGDLSKLAGKPIRIKKGKSPIIVRYQSPDKGDAKVRVYWESPDMPREPVKILHLSHNADATPLRESRRLREGRELYATLRCGACHDAAHTHTVAETAMPELEIDAPSLADAGARLQANWIAAWVSNPRALRPDSSMPQVIHGATAEKDAADIAGYIASLGAVAPKPPAPPPEAQLKAGGELFATLGCIGCHTLPSRADFDAEKGRLPLRFVRAKWNADALIAFLKEPTKHYKWIRMPNFKFSDKEAEDIAAFVLYSPLDDKNWPIKPIAAPDATRGRQLAEQNGCLNCHDVGKGVEHPLKAPEIGAGKGDWNKGCLAADPAGRGKAPNFSLSPPQREALLAFAATDRTSLQQEALPEFAQRQVNVMRCTACHKRDETEDYWTGLEEETAALKPPPAAAADPNSPESHGMVDQLRPQLTWIGEKLKPEWFTAFIGGQIKYKPRPWLHARMPSFPVRAPLLAKGIVMEHGMVPVSPPDEKQDAAQIAAGKKLSSQNGGLACTKCHSVGKTQAIGVFEAPGINFMYVKERILKSFYHRWVMNPLGVEPGTKMPSFANEGKTGLTEFFGGDARQQFEAIYQYLLDGENIKTPDE